ncbi:MAG: FAD-binding protein [Bacteroidales bacterium]|nr:FAD-binding protein [Bacteroidales bacterium]
MTIDIDLTPQEYCTETLLREKVARKVGLHLSDISHVQVLRRSLDSRRGRLTYHTTVKVYCGEKYVEPDYRGKYQDCFHSPRVIIVGAGPAGLFASLRALELGLKPIIIERGKPVEQRRKDIALIARSQEVNPNSNWCFGEGGAGTYSDGKLYTRSTKRGNIQAVLHRFIEHGADPAITIDAHAHIGTDKLSGIIANMRHTIEQYGGEYHFSTRMADLLVEQGKVCGVKDSEGNEHRGIAVVLATGHSARDIYELFARRGWMLEAKPFAIGVRVEHPQELINQIQYHAPNPQTEYLPPAAYSLTTQVDVHGVFSFCMCPGGCIVPAATDGTQQVVNGMSNSQRNSPFANSGIAVTVSPQDIPEYSHHGALALLRFQQEVERHIFEMAGGSITAPIQRLTDFCENRMSQNNNRSNYLGKTLNLPQHELLPRFIVKCLQQGFRDFDRKMHGFYTEQASILSVESRTSSPVRIPRDETLQHPQLRNLYPCGEGAGYAGGIVSSAMDGIHAIEQIKSLL